MTQLEVLRRDHLALIAEDPVSISIHRVAYRDNGRGGREVASETDLPAFTGRLVPVSPGRRRQSEGELAQAAEMLLLAPYDADVRADSLTEDSFASGGRKHRVRSVRDRRWAGEVYARHAEVEVVS